MTIKSLSLLFVFIILNYLESLLVNFTLVIMKNYYYFNNYRIKLFNVLKNFITKYINYSIILIGKIQFIRSLFT